jgi:hypothetical protein
MQCRSGWESTGGREGNKLVEAGVTKSEPQERMTWVHTKARKNHKYIVSSGKKNGQLDSKVLEEMLLTYKQHGPENQSGEERLDKLEDRKETYE